MTHSWRGKVLSIPGLILNYGGRGAATGRAHFMLVPPPKNQGCPIYDVGINLASGERLPLESDINNNVSCNCTTTL